MTRASVSTADPLREIPEAIQHKHNRVNILQLTPTRKTVTNDYDDFLDAK